MTKRDRIRQVVVGVSVTSLCGLLTACAELGFTNRVLHSVASPDGRFVAICQEVPALDGPDFDVRLHRPDGTLARRLHHGGDAYRCDELVWSPDSRRLAVLSRANSHMVLIDVDAALRKPAEEGLWNRIVTLTDRGEMPSDLRFVSPTRIAYLSCRFSLLSAPVRCTTDARDRRLEL